MISYLIFRGVILKSAFSGLVAGSSIEALAQTVTDNGQTQLLLGLFSLVGVLGVAGIAAFVNLRIAKSNAGVDMKEVRRLRKDVKNKDKIIDALTKKDGEQ